MMPTNTVSGFHIEPTNICTLKCPGCARTQFIDQWPQHWKNYNLDISKLIKFLDVDLTNLKITLCGNYGDPIYHPNFIELVSELKARGCVLVIITNGSYKTQSWWESLVELLDNRDTVMFSIDGTPDTFTKYRINGDWESIKLGIKVCTSKCQTVWKFIPFEFNESLIDQAQEISQSLSMNRFLVDPSSRFDEKTAYLKPSDQNIRNTYTQQIHWKKNSRVLDLDPRCANQHEHYISAEGYYTPCCFIADRRFYYKTVFGKDRQKYNIANTTISEILEMPVVRDFMQQLNSQSVCSYSCPRT